MGKTLKERLMEEAGEGKLKCGAVRKIAEELRIPYGAAGRACDELRLKITDCELGCFR